MPAYLVQRGFAVQIDNRDFAFQRMLDEKTVQLEDIRTGAFRTITLKKLQVGVADGVYRILGAKEMDQGWVAETEARAGTAAVYAQLSARHQEEWQRRLSYVRALRRRGVTRGDKRRVKELLPAVACSLQDDSPPSPSTAVRWLSSYEKAGSVASSLIPRGVTKVKESRKSRAVLEYAWTLLKRHYFRRDGVSLVDVHRRIEREVQAKPHLRNESLSLSTLRRVAAELPAYERDRARLGPAAASAKWRHSIGGIYATRPLERVEMDHTELDLYVIDDVRGIPLGRPVLTMLIDSYSHYILSIYLSFEGESLGRMSRAIKLALQPKDELTAAASTENEWITPGMWECLVVDNGLAFQSAQLRQIALALGCELEYCPVRKPWFKPTVERAIGESGRILPAAGRPAKLRGLADRKDPVGQACIMFSDLVLCLTHWVVDVHPFSIPSRSLERPIDRLRSGLAAVPAPVVYPGLDSLEIITGMAKEVTVGHSGIEFMYLPYRSPALEALVKRQRSPSFKTMMKYDPNDLGRVWVQDPSDKSWLCLPCLYEDYASGLSKRQHQLIRQSTKESLRGIGAYGALMRAQERLQTMWDDAIRKGKTKIRRNKQFAIFSGISSVAGMSSDQHVVDATKIVTDEEQAVAAHEMPHFSAVRLGDQDGWENRA